MVFFVSKFQKKHLIVILTHLIHKKSFIVDVFVRTQE